ncbi:MAG: helix-turn-helix domain-containing protein [Eubacteriales bacterium]|nr:helix-turn-helix domain-containing protein [Eubacteriales bacterium]
MRKSKINDKSNKIKLVLIDDDISLLEVLERFLENEGYNCTSFSDVDKALQHMKTNKFDIMLLDYYLTDTDASKVIDKIRKGDGINSEIYIVLLTGFSKLQPPLTSLRDMDIQGYVEKSNRLEDVLVEIEKVKKTILKMNQYIAESNKTLGSRIKELRKANGMTQEELSDMLGLVRTAVVAYEQDINEPSVANLKKLADIFKVSIDYLLGYGK